MKTKYLHLVSVLVLVLFVISFRPAYSQSWTAAGSVTGVGTSPSISVVDQDIVWIAGGPSGSPQVRRTINGGGTWTMIPTTGILLDLFCVWGIDATTAYVGDGGAAGGAGGNATFYKTTNAGVSWTPVASTGGTLGFMNGIVFSKINPLIGVAQSDPPTGGTGPYYISKTINGGITWTPEAPPGIASGLASAQNSIVVIDDQFYGFGLNATPTRIYLTINGGLTWNVRALNIAGGFISGFAFKENKSIGLAASSTSLPSISRSVDGGVSWAPLNTGVGVTGYCNLKWIEKSSTAYLSGAVGAGGVVKKSTDDGLTWTIMPTGGVVNITHMEFRRIANTVYGYAVNAAGTVIKLVDVITPTNTSTLNLTVNLQACSPTPDVIDVLMRSAVSPYLIVDSTRALLSASGTAALTFTHVFNGINYYIVAKHRNSIETWSKSGGEVFSGGVLNYDFTTAASQAFGSNMVLVGSEYSFYTGDVNQDGTVDLTDLSLIDNDAFNFVTGYVSTDLNCDMIVDVTDATFADNNASNFVALVRP
ncbi:MAG: hypothetical protein M3R36_14450 [Bacteroidota bacterium]|nr:hypothetical protein [Bacteroidota bacterium]